MVFGIAGDQVKLERGFQAGAIMTLQTLKVGKERLVVLRERDYKKLLAQIGEEHKYDAGDAAESRRRMKEPGGITLAQMKKKLGL